MHRPARLQAPASRAGFALVIVLGFVVLLTVLVIAFYSSVTTDYQSSKQYSSGAATKQLADSAVQVVMGQLKTATASTATAGTSLTWASQPGMIRSYDANGNSVANYKLYSSDATMTLPGTFVPVAGTDFNTMPSTQPALWTDLNAPVTDATGTANFPIIDGNNVTRLTQDGTGKTVPAYYGYDTVNNTTFTPGADGVPDIQGFGVDPAQVNYNAASPLSPTNTPVPLPVKWMYQLSDGTLIAPDASSTTTATFANAAVQPSTSNPIVGRIAYWTDDETSKVNVNTAGQGTFWDTPHFSSTALPYGAVTSANASQFSDYAYAAFQPGLFEFQRYPGHPSLVALNTVFPGVTWATAGGVTPRISNFSSGTTAGGSQGGTQYPTPSINPALAARKALYASVDEFLYSGTSGTPRTVNSVATSTQGPQPLTKAQLENAKFFVTASSRAPEVNLFGKPRVCMWPINSDLAINANSPYTTAYDRLISFCASMHNAPASGTAPATPYRYFFQRSNSQSATADYTGIADNPRLYNYLLGLMQQTVPGFGNSFANKYGTDTQQILTEIFDYIRCTNLSDPNLNPDPNNPGGSTMTNLATWAKAPYVFANYQPTSGNDVYCGQVMPIQIPAIQPYTNPTMGFGRYYTIKDVSMIFSVTGDGTSVSSNPLWTGAPTSGDGGLGGFNAPASPATPVYQYSDFPALQSPLPTTAQIAANPFFKTAPGYTDLSKPGYNSANWNYTLPQYNWSSDTTGTAWTGLAPGQKRVQLALALNYFLPSPGQLKCGPDMLVRITGLNNIQITGAANIDGGSLFPAAPTASGWVGKIMATSYNGYNPVDAVLKFRYPFAQHRAPFYVRPQIVNGSAATRIIYPFVSRAFTVAAGTTLTLTAPVTLTIELFQAKSAYDSNDAALASTYIAPGAPTYNAITGGPTTVNPNNANLIQTINITLPAGTFPQPTLPTSSAVVSIPAGMSPQAVWGFDGKIASAANPLAQASSLISSATTTTPPIVTVCYDTVRTVDVVSGDVRAVAASNVIAPTSTLFGADSPTTSSYNNTTLTSYHYFTDNASPAGEVSTGKLVTGAVSTSILCPPNTATNYCAYGDWDGPDVRIGSGAFINKPDEGDNASLGTGGTSSIPYYGFNESTAKNISLYTPNRVMPSPGMLGSLPTGVLRNLPWVTLLFRPQPGHPNAAVPASVPPYTSGPPFTTIPDHLIMDLFWMPVVEPYAISEAFSTAGKINLNYRIAPFSYITRATGMMSLLQSEKIAARPLTVDQASTTAINLRLPINPSEVGGTLQQVKAVFDAGNLFRSATQVCDLDLVPFTDPNGVPQTWGSGWGTNFWAANANTGDNLRERPYADLYARLTTKSNSYTVHFRVQSLQKSINTDPTKWVEGRDRIAGEYRGSSLIERYLDPDDPTIVDFAAPANSGKNLDSFYKFRVVSTKKFAP